VSSKILGRPGDLGVDTEIINPQAFILPHSFSAEVLDKQRVARSPSMRSSAPAAKISGHLPIVDYRWRDRARFRRRRLRRTSHGCGWHLQVHIAM